MVPQANAYSGYDMFIHQNGRHENNSEETTQNNSAF